MKSVVKNLLCLMCAAVWFSHGMSAEAIDKNGSFFVGYNQAWFKSHFQTSLAPDPAHGFQKSNFNLPYLKLNFSRIRQAGGSVVRFWLVMDQEGLVLTKRAPQTKSILPEMLINIEKVLQVAKANRLKVYFTILEMDDQQNEPDHQVERDYYWNLFNNEYGEGDAFNQNAVAPILKVLDSYKDDVYGIDLFNEMNHAVDNGMFLGGWTGARKWIRRTAAFIKSKSPWVRVTSTAGQNEVGQGLLSGLGLDFYDVHDYADSVGPSRYASACAVARNDRLPIILGEFGQGSPQKDDWLQVRATNSFLSTAFASCFSAAFAWRMDSEEWQWSFVNSNGDFRPAVDSMKLYAAMSFSSSWQGQNTVTRCGSIRESELKGFWPQPGAIGCYTTYIGATAQFPNCQIDSFEWYGQIYEQRWGCGKPQEPGFYVNGNRDGKPIYHKAIWWP